MLLIGSILFVFEKASPLACQVKYWLCEVQLTKPANMGIYSRFSSKICMVNCMLCRRFYVKLIAFRLAC